MNHSRLLRWQSSSAFFVIICAALCVSLLIGMSPNTARAQEGGQAPTQTQHGVSAYDSLAEILENDESRAELISELRRLAGSSVLDDDAGVAIPAEEDMVAPSGQAPDQVSFARKIANTTQDFAQSLVSEFSGGVGALASLTETRESLNLAAIGSALLNLGLVIVATVVLFMVLRRLARPVFHRANMWVKAGSGPSLIRRGVAIIGSAILDVSVVVFAWVGGYLLALFVIGESGGMDARESLFLNAFLLIEVFKAALRVLFASRDDSLRLLPMPAEEAAYWNAWLARLSGFIGYGVLLIVPMINFNISPALGRMVTLAIMGLAFIYALAVILQNRDRVSDALQKRANNADMAVTRVALGMLARSWHILAVAYFAALAIVTLLRPDTALPMMLSATVQTLAAIGVGAFVSLVLTQIISRQLILPPETRERFPMLEGRINGFVPKALRVMRLLIIAAVAMVVINAWGVFDVATWLGSDAGTHMLGALISVLVIILLASVLWIGLASWIEQRLNPNTGNGEPSARERTLLTIFRNAIAVVLIVITVMIVLAEIGINIGPLIAGAGVLGLAIGFGGQKLVQDVITGVFIQLENAINAGDIVTAGGVTGTAEKLTIRSLGIRDLSGTYHLIPFSSVDTVANYMREFAYHVGVYGVAYRENTDEVIVLLRNAFDELISDDEQRAKIIGELEVHGVTALGDSAVDIRIRIKTLPGVQWAVGRAYNRLVKQHLDAAGVEIPFPHMTLYFGQDKDGSAPPAPLVLQQPATKNLPGSAKQDPRAKTNAKENEDYDDADD
ncbi:mechanosensitive channel protein [Alcanivorax sp. JB21]|uniref:mechanosensitive channel protein n=1 Tax=Alcanivorax limicola TaxID=2874102 RepID=UPI001CBD6348|nr:mechanosensitive channel protein [Alcanivorax limicola]MBZ2190367.1 mechanosensitive channel protein [Alcanivorax limicola]